MIGDLLTVLGLASLVIFILGKLYNKFKQSKGTSWEEELLARIEEDKYLEGSLEMVDYTEKVKGYYKDKKLIKEIEGRLREEGKYVLDVDKVYDSSGYDQSEENKEVFYREYDTLSAYWDLKGVGVNIYRIKREEKGFFGEWVSEKELAFVVKDLTQVQVKRRELLSEKELEFHKGISWGDNREYLFEKLSEEDMHSSIEKVSTEKVLKEIEEELINKGISTIELGHTNVGASEDLGMYPIEGLDAYKKYWDSLGVSNKDWMSSGKRYIKLSVN